MTPRTERLTRLAALRALQHDVAIAELRTANHRFQAAAEAYAREARAIPEARCAMRHALQASDQAGWLTSCADAEWSTLSMRLCKQQRDSAAQTLRVAATAEAEARCASKQMDTAVEVLEREREQLTARSEQQRLDEIARGVRCVPEHAMTMRRIP